MSATDHIEDMQVDGCPSCGASYYSPDQQCQNCGHEGPEVQVVEVVDGEVVPEVALVPWTGEALALPDLTDEQIAQLLDETRQFERARLTLFKRDVQDEILKRMDAATEWTMHTDSYDLSGDSPNRTEFDGGELKDALDQLVDAELLTPQQRDKALICKLELPGVPDEDLLARAKKVEYVASRSGLNALKRLGGVVEVTIKSCERKNEKPRAVRVTPKPQGGAS